MKASLVFNNTMKTKAMWSTCGFWEGTKYGGQGTKCWNYKYCSLKIVNMAS